MDFLASQFNEFAAVLIIAAAVGGVGALLRQPLIVMFKALLAGADPAPGAGT